MIASHAQAYVLLVECDEAQLSLLGEMIATGGYTVVSCHDFGSARRYLQTHTPCAIVTDLRLGPFNGLHLVLLARGITVIVYSDKQDAGIRPEAALTGASYLEKETLRSSLLSHLGAMRRPNPKNNARLACTGDIIPHS